MIRDGMPQLVGAVSLADWYGTAARTISCLFVFSRRDAFSYLQPVFFLPQAGFQRSELM